MTDRRLRVDDEPGRLERTTSSLLESLIARITTLTVVSGADAVGSIMAGMANLGKEAATTAEGGRLRTALAAGRAGTNVAALWHRLGIDAAVSRMPPTPVLIDLRNDVALLAAADLWSALEGLDAAFPFDAVGPVRSPEHVDPVDVLVGLWAFGGELAGAVAALAEPTMPGRVSREVPAGSEAPSGPVLR